MCEELRVCTEDKRKINLPNKDIVFIIEVLIFTLLDERRGLDWRLGWFVVIGKSEDLTTCGYINTL